MKKDMFPWLACGLGFVLALGLYFSGATKADGNYNIPSLTLLFISEFGFFVTAAGVFSGIKMWLQQRNNINLLFTAILCAVLMVLFGWIGFSVWGNSVVR